MENFRMLPKNELGVQKVLSILNQLTDKNETYYTNTLQYMCKKHLPFENSVIVYHPTNNRFNFLSISKLTGKTLSNWISYNTGNDVLLREREKGFIYNIYEPFEVIVADANWILSGDLKHNVDYFYNYMKNNTKIEKEIWKNHLSINQKMENIKLF